MSTTQQQQPEPEPEQPEQRTVECRHPDCERAGRPWDFQAGYCSRKHWHQHLGRKALSHVRTSHTRCFTCFATLKEIEQPKPDMEFRESGVELTYNPEKDYIEAVRYGQEVTRKAAIGYQYLRPEATIGEKEVGPKTVTGTICGECGSTNHKQHIAMIADGHRTAALAVEHLQEQDDDDFSPFNTELLHRRYIETGDIAEAAGAAIIDCRS